MLLPDHYGTRPIYVASYVAERLTSDIPYFGSLPVAARAPALRQPLSPLLAPVQWIKCIG